mmetsp:Transcript_25807/g.25082  ORF Transcript_25807/g.25082 Transcript_25807/m.25082 type:complete len:86 (-) Transcript_25807:906-1163(-)
MANKLGLNKEYEDQMNNDHEAEKNDKFQRVDVDKHGAKKNVAKIINENIERVTIFDEETNIKHKSNQKLEVSGEDLDIGMVGMVE